MSFGRPGTFDNFKVSPPARGSFPLDHDGECKTFMLDYMKCLKANKNDNGQCRLQSKRYLECRMDNGLMERDSMENLGLGDLDRKEAQKAAEEGKPLPAPTTPHDKASARI